MPTCVKCGYYDATDAEFDDTRTICDGCVSKFKFEYYDFFISIAYGYLGQFVEVDDDDALAYEVQFDVHESEDKFVFDKMVTRPSRFTDADLTDDVKRQFEDLVNAHYRPSDDVKI